MAVAHAVVTEGLIGGIDMAGMPKPHVLEIDEGTAATWTTSTDVMDQDIDAKVFKSVPFPRILRSMACVGDTPGTAGPVQGVKGVIGGQLVAKILSSATSGMHWTDYKFTDCPVAPNETVAINITGASATNPFVVGLDFDIDYGALAAMARGGRRYRR